MPSRNELVEDLRVFAPEIPEAGLFDVFDKYDLEPPCFFAVADEEEQSKLMFAVVCGYYICMSVLQACVNRANADGDEAAEKFATAMNEHMADVTSGKVTELNVDWLDESLKDTGYKLSITEKRTIDMMRKWYPELEKVRGWSSIVTKPHLATFVSGLMMIGTGDHYRPYHLLGNMELSGPEADQLAEAMLEGIENNAHGWALANLTIGGSLQAFLELVIAHPGKTLWTLCPSSLAEQVIRGARLADRAIANKSVTTHRAGTSFEMDVHPQAEGCTATEAIRNALAELAKNVDKLDIQMRGVMVMDDTGKVVTIEQFFADRGEEVPQDVLDQFAEQGLDT